MHTWSGMLGGLTTWDSIWLLFTPVRTLLPAEGVASLLVLGVLLCVGRDAGAIEWDGRKAQVPPRWVRVHGPVRAFGLYGLVLGSGLFTHVPFSLYYVALLLAALQESAFVALCSGLLVGLGRTAVVAMAGTRLQAKVNAIFAAGLRQPRAISLIVGSGTAVCAAALLIAQVR